MKKTVMTIVVAALCASFVYLRITQWHSRNQNTTTTNAVSNQTVTNQNNTISQNQNKNLNLNANGPAPSGEDLQQQCLQQSGVWIESVAKGCGKTTCTVTGCFDLKAAADPSGIGCTNDKDCLGLCDASDVLSNVNGVMVAGHCFGPKKLFIQVTE